MTRLPLTLLLAVGALAACSAPRAPAPVEYRGVGSGAVRMESVPAGQMSGSGGIVSAPIYSEGYQPPPSPGSIQMQELPPPNSPINPNSVSSTPLNSGEPDDAYAQAAQQMRPAPAMTLPPAAPAAPAVVQPAPATPPTLNQGTGQFGWPLRGRLISDYGPKAGGQANDGLNIAAPLGTAVAAAADGVVAYAGNEIRNFGNMVLLRHSNGLFTVYAHLDQILVSKDAKVTRGMSIGTVGTSGGVAEPQLHFEVRRNSKPLDPRPFLGG